MLVSIWRELYRLYINYVRRVRMKIHKILDIYHRALNQHLYSMVRTRRLYYFACNTARRFSSMSIVSMSLCNETEVLLCRHCNEGCGTQYSPCAVCGVTILVHLRAGLVLPLLAHLRSITQCHRVLLSQGQRTCSTRYRKSSWLSPELWRNLRNWNKKDVNILETSTHFSNIFVFY